MAKLFVEQDAMKTHKPMNKANAQPSWLIKFGQQRIYYIGESAVGKTTHLSHMGSQPQCSFSFIC